MLAGPPDVDRILDAHPQFTEAVARFSAVEDHHLIVLSGNHDGQLAWDTEAIGVLGRRLGVHHFALSCDLVISTEQGPQRVRVVHGNQSDPYNAFEDPWSPVDTPFGHHVVRDLLPELESRQGPGSLLEGVQWLDGDIADFIGSRLFYRKIVGKLWLVAIPFVAILLIRLLSFLPGVHNLLHHHAQRWLLGFGLLVAFMVIVAGVAAVATLLRVNRALRETAVSARSDPASHNAPPRAEAARLVTQGYAGMVSGHTHEPELSVVGSGFYANTGSGTCSVVSRKVTAPASPPLRHRPPLLLSRDHRRQRAPAQPLAPGGAGALPGPAREDGEGPEQDRHVRHHRWWGRCPTGRPGPWTTPCCGGG